MKVIRRLQLFGILVLLSAFIISCEKEMERPPSIKELTVSRYRILLDSLNLHCPEATSESYFKGIINGIETCYYDGVNGLESNMHKVVTFTTATPSFNTNTSYGGAANLFRFGIYNYFRKSFVENLEFISPNYPIYVDPERYLDSIFAIKVHKLREKEGEFDKFNVCLSIGYPLEIGGHMIFEISTHYGPQKDSKLVINSVKKERIGTDLYYNLDITLDCILYHWPQTDRIGEWGKIENGRLVARFKPEFFN